MSAQLADASRREFLSRAARAGGSLVIALTVPAFGAKSRSKAFAEEGGKLAPSQLKEVQLNAWLVIGADDSTTIIVDRSEMGQGVYTALPMLLAEELEIDLAGIQVVAAPVGDAYVNVLNGGQVTGTSNSVPDAWERLRTAGAQARLMLIAAAAQAWQLDPGQCRAQNGTVVHPSGKTFRYGELAAAAARMPVPKDVALKQRSEFRLIGTPAARLDSPGKVDGSAEFGLDVKLPGMLHAAIALSPTLGGRLASLDARAAESMAGVRRVLPTASGVVVVAEHFWQALKARGALKLAWDPGPNRDLDNAAMTALLERAAARGPGLSAPQAAGDAPGTLKSASAALAAVYELPMLAHATMEPMNCTADVKPDGCDLYVGTQVQQEAQTAAATAAGLKPAQVNVHTTLLGGGFGRRLEVDFIPAAVEASKAVGAPVKLIWTREDDMTHDLYRPPVRVAMDAGLDGGGKLLAFSLHITSPSITQRFAPSTIDPFDSVIEYAQNFPYDVPNYGLNYTRQEVGIDVGYLRSVSHGPNCFAIEAFMDEVAAAAAADPLEYRLRLLEKKPRHANVLKLAAARANWSRAPQGRHQGVAMMEGYSSHIAQIVELSLEHGTLKLHKITCVVDCGQMVNPRIVESQIESGVVFGLTAALWGEVTIDAGRVRQSNFNTCRMLRGNELPELDVHLVASDAAPGGIGELAVGAVAPAICNALFAATGKRIRSLPIGAHGFA